ncbi:MAG: GNAT family N-acetyltransferase [Hyphomicrobium sp.]|jgi:CelD/BcsL family acetyltransferase involved in cellulose biosynthesis
MLSARTTLPPKDELPLAPGRAALLALYAPPSCTGVLAANDPEYALITDRSSFEALEGEWNALFDRAARGRHVFQSFNWLWHWSNHFLPKRGDLSTTLAIVTARRRGKLVLVWPLVSKRTGPITKLCWMGDPVSQYGDVLVDDGPDTMDLLRGAWNVIRTRTGASVVQLRKVRADSHVARLLDEVGASPIIRLVAPHLDLTEAQTFAEYETRFSSKARKTRRSQRRRFEKLGTAALEHHRQGPIAKYFAGEAIELKRRWLEARGLASPAIADKRTKAFFEDVCEAVIRPAGAQVLSLTSNGIPAAIEIGIIAKGHVAIHVIAYDAAFEKASAGSLLMEDSIRRAFAEGCRTFDLLAPGDRYKLQWADKSVEVCDWAKALTPGGLAYANLYLRGVRGYGKQVIAGMPIALRRPLSLALAFVLTAAARLR